MDTNEDYLDSLLKSVTEPEKKSENIPEQESFAEVPMSENDLGLGEELGLGGDLGLGEELGLGGDLGLGEELGLGGDLGLGEDLGLGSDLGLGEDLGLGSDLGLGEDLGLGGDLGLGEDLGLGSDLGLGEALGLESDLSAEIDTENIDEDFNLEEFLAQEELADSDIPTIEIDSAEAEEQADSYVEPEVLDFAQADAILPDVEKGEGESGVVREKETGDSWDTPVESAIKKQTPSIFDSIRQEMQSDDGFSSLSDEDMLNEANSSELLTEPLEMAEMPETEDVFGAGLFEDGLGLEDIETLDIPELDLSGEGTEAEGAVDAMSEALSEGADAFDFESTDLADLLAGSSGLEDDSIEEISTLLDMDANNEAVSDDVMALFESVSEEESEEPLDVMQLLAGGETPVGKKKKEKKPKKEKKVKQPKEPKDGEETVKEKKPGLLAKILSFLDEGEEDEADSLITSLQEENDAILMEMGGETGVPDLLPEKKDPEPEKEEEVDKKEQEKKEKQEQKEKAKKEKQEKKEQKRKEKEEKRERERQEAALRPKFPKKKAISIFVVCIMLMFAFLTLSKLLTSHSIKKNAIDAYYAGDYLQCYELLYGQERADSEDLMYHRSEIYMKMQLERNRYDKYQAAGKELEAVDHYVQFLVDYPDMYEYSLRWQAEDIMEDMYLHVTDTLFGSYGLTESEALEINALRKDEDYTRALTKVVAGTFHEKPVEEPTGPVYEDMLPEEEARLGVTGENN